MPIKAKANIEAKRKHGRTALHLAAPKLSEATARMLIVQGMANIEANDKVGRTALHLATENG